MANDDSLWRGRATRRGFLLSMGLSSIARVLRTGTPAIACRITSFG
jgi:hypothetical protein